MENTELSIILPAFIAGLLVLSTHVPLGIEVLRRGIIFIDLAIAQMAGLGALAATLFFEGHDKPNVVVIQLCSLLAALSGGVFLHWAEKRFPEIQEALIGCLFVLSASLALLVLGQNPHGGEHMKDLLAGQILFVSYTQIIIVAFIYAFLLAIWFLRKEKLGRMSFYLVFAIAITASVQLLGVYLVFASLILPAIATQYNNKSRLRLLQAYIIGIAGLASGLSLSVYYDLATSPTIVCTLFVIALCIIFINTKDKKLKNPLV